MRVLPMYLTKSDFTRGKECPTGLWLDKYEPHRKRPPTRAERERMTAGLEIGRLAQGLHPAGVMAFSPGALSEENAQRTAGLMQEGHEVLFEATFLSRQRLARVDILRREESGGWRIQEVKSSTLKPVKDLLTAGKVHDVAFQVHTALSAGTGIEGADLILIDGTYRHGGNGYDLNRLFGTLDVGTECSSLATEVEEIAAQLEQTIADSEPPPLETNTQCAGCQYYDYCHENQPARDVVFLPAIRANQVRELRSLGYPTIDAIPADYPLPAAMRRARDVVVSGHPRIDPGLSSALETIAFPAAFIDFETSNPALPLLAGTRPYEQVCFQWSAHLLRSADGVGLHRAFLHDSESDPRAAFCASLWEAVRDCATLVYYTGFEVARLKEMAAGGIPFARELFDLISEIGVDLEKIVRANVVYEQFKGRTSIKVVLPTLVPDMSYADLAIADGNAAACGFREMVGPGVSPSRALELRTQLLDYCCRDTLAMVEVYRALRSVAGPERVVERWPCAQCRRESEPLCVAKADSQEGWVCTGCGAFVPVDEG